jgi:hypothetical protein
MNGPTDFELTPFDVTLMQTYMEDLEAEERFIARTKEACEWLENSQKVARKKYKERITIFEIEASKLPPDVAAYALKHYQPEYRTDRGGNPLASAIILMGIILGVMLVTWLSIHFGGAR